jgi:hypothetical protein
MIAMVSPGSQSADHSLNTLRYADRVKEFKADKEEKLDDLVSPTEKKVTEPTYEPDLEPIVDTFDDVMNISSYEQPYGKAFGQSFQSLDDFSVTSTTSQDALPFLDSLSTNDKQKSDRPSYDSYTTPTVAKNLIPSPQATPKREPKVNIHDLQDDVIQLHLQTMSRATVLGRKERKLLAEQTDWDNDPSIYVDEMMSILDERIEIWTTLRAKINEMKQYCK